MSSADFNAFGEDKYGVKAHCFAWFFGPAYVPEAFDDPLHPACRVLPPRYGPPSRQQVPWLPVGWKPNPPPSYYGTPAPPFLPKPRIFDPNLFKQLERACRRKVVDLSYYDTDVEVMDNVFSVTVMFRSGNRLEHFNVLTNETWDKFRAMACIFMGVGQDSCLAYRQFYGELGNKPSNGLFGSYGPVFPLTSTKGWAKATSDLRKAGRKLLGVEIEILTSSAEAQLSWDAGGDLPIIGLQVKTYHFEYPQLDDLLDMLGGSLEVLLVGFIGSENIGEILRRAGLEYLDDFGMLSPRSLHIYEGIPVDAVRLLYSGADEMIRAIHVGLKEEIRGIEEAIRK